MQGSNRWSNEITPSHIARAAEVSRESIHRNISLLIKMYKKHPERLEKFKRK